MNKLWIAFLGVFIIGLIFGVFWAVVAMMGAITGVLIVGWVGKKVDQRAAGESILRAIREMKQSTPRGL